MKPSLTILWWITGALFAAAAFLLAGLTVAQVVVKRHIRYRREADNRASELCLDILSGGHGSLPHVRARPSDLLAAQRLRKRLASLINQDALERLDEAMRTRRRDPHGAIVGQQNQSIDWVAPPALAAGALIRFSPGANQA